MPEKRILLHLPLIGVRSSMVLPSSLVNDNWEADFGNLGSSRALWSKSASSGRPARASFSPPVLDSQAPLPGFNGVGATGPMGPGS